MRRRDKHYVNTAHDKGPDKKHNLCPRQMEKPKEKLLLQVCNECRQLERGKIDPNDENFYCVPFSFEGIFCDGSKFLSRSLRREKVHQKVTFTHVLNLCRSINFTLVRMI